MYQVCCIGIFYLMFYDFCYSSIFLSQIRQHLQYCILNWLARQSYPPIVSFHSPIFSFFMPVISSKFLIIIRVLLITSPTICSVGIGIFTASFCLHCPLFEICWLPFLFLLFCLFFSDIPLSICVCQEGFILVFISKIFCNLRKWSVCFLLYGSSGVVFLARFYAYRCLLALRLIVLKILTAIALHDTHFNCDILLCIYLCLRVIMENVLGFSYQFL